MSVVNLAVLARADFQWAEIGYSIHNQYWRQGYASSMLLQLKEAAEVLGFHRLEAHVHPLNIPSQNLLKKSGFYLEGIRKNFQKEGQEWQDREVYVWIEG
ncbi:GNAT family N-acetyltransferase [Streptococcus panodentis]|uniref:GNAT family N-acetyltransferase n=1 Tax=Streptococcus panodentis TaxID=1581472 RepID=UPI001FD8FA76|nr:GNAT family protein [Streptococcus panodentis]